ncbi:MAG: serine/threonine protein kinase [Betaproteobacteria bacterium]|nr:serine/threonine protein kinase [Betaproteobacteria bacterium]
MSGTAPFSDLSPDLILDAVDEALQSAGLRTDGRQLALNSYENRVYQVGIEDSTPIIAKFYRPARWSDEQILEEHAFALELAEAEIPVVAPSVIGGRTLLQHGGYRFTLFERRGGRAPELDDPETLEWLGRFLARIHNIGATRIFAKRPALDISTFGEEPREWLLANDFIPANIREAWIAATEQALEGAKAAFDRAGGIANIRLHGDCHGGNILWREGEGPHFVDLDDSRMGPAIQDLWMFLSGDRASMTRQFSDVLAGYEDFREFDRRELHLIEALRTLRLIHYSAWLARRWDDPAFPMAFPWFNTQQYWQDRILELREQIAAMQEPPLGPL